MVMLDAADSSKGRVIAARHRLDEKLSSSIKSPRHGLNIISQLFVHVDPRHMAS